MIRYVCLECRMKMASPEALAGQSEVCPQCGASVLVPSSPQSQMDPPVAPQDDSAVLSVLKDIRGEIRWITIWIKIAVVIVGGCILFGLIAAIMSR